MGLFDFIKSRKPATAQTAKERLLIIVSQERAQRGGPDYLPLLRRELLEVIRKYVQVDSDAVQVKVAREGEHEVLELSVSLPEKNELPPPRD